jgi:hypothetical protein
MRLAGRVAVVVLFVSAVALAVWWVRRDDRPPLERAVALVSDRSGFTEAEESSATLAEVSVLLLESARSCEPGTGALTSRCDARLEAAAYTQVLAAEVARCPPAGRQEVRVTMTAYLRALADESRAVAPPDPPTQPRCG